jgi:hypothetical protein
MTIANVLRLNGIDVPRSISPTGRVIFQTGNEESPVYAPLKPHTFHGGLETPDGEPTRDWWTEPGALDSEMFAMETWFPGFSLIPQESSEPPAWFGSIQTGRGTFDVVVQHRRDHGLPLVIPIRPKRFERSDSFRRRIPSPHLYLSGNLCVASAEDWSAREDTAATVVGWAAHWYAMYAEWLFTGHWPTEGYQPNVA